MMLADTDLACPVTYCKCNLINPSIKWITSLIILKRQEGSAAWTSNLGGSSYPHIPFICNSYLFVVSSPPCCLH